MVDILVGSYQREDGMKSSFRIWCERKADLICLNMRIRRSMENKEPQQNDVEADRPSYFEEDPDILEREMKLVGMRLALGEARLCVEHMWSAAQVVLMIEAQIKELEGGNG